MTDGEPLRAAREQNERLRQAVASLMDGSVFKTSLLYPEGAWQSIRVPSEEALTEAKSVLEEPPA